MSAFKLINTLPQCTSKHPPPLLAATHCSLCQTFIHFSLPSPHPPLLSHPSFIYPIPLSFTPIYYVCKSNLRLSLLSTPSDAQQKKWAPLFFFLAGPASSPVHVRIHAYVNDPMPDTLIESAHLLWDTLIAIIFIIVIPRSRLTSRPRRHTEALLHRPIVREHKTTCSLWPGE